ncbi:MAG: tyrosine-type recombinase/integrase [Tannerellaceae bacterium]|nr:tyrosine-type recombinase/integrase [Tannerellaceae bacterium]
MNEYLKKIAKEVDIDKPISHKVGRHTFATIYLRKTKDLTSLKELLGHSELRETLIYAHVLDESKQEGVQVFNSFTL